MTADPGFQRAQLVREGRAVQYNPFRQGDCGHGPGAHDSTRLVFKNRWGVFSEFRRVRTVTDEERDRVVRLVEDEQAQLAQNDRPCWWAPTGRFKVTPSPVPESPSASDRIAADEHMSAHRLGLASAKRAQEEHAAGVAAGRIRRRPPVSPFPSMPGANAVNHPSAG